MALASLNLLIPYLEGTNKCRVPDHSTGGPRRPLGIVGQEEELCRQPPGDQSAGRMIMLSLRAFRTSWGLV